MSFKGVSLFLLKNLEGVRIDAEGTKEILGRECKFMIVKHERNIFVFTQGNDSPFIYVMHCEHEHNRKPQHANIALGHSLKDLIMIHCNDNLNKVKEFILSKVSENEQRKGGKAA